MSPGCNASPFSSQREAQMLPVESATRYCTTLFPSLVLVVDPFSNAMNTTVKFFMPGLRSDSFVVTVEGGRRSKGEGVGFCEVIVLKGPE